MESLHGFLVTHKQASMAEIECVQEYDASVLLEKAVDCGAEEAYVLQTCNRASVYISGPKEAIDHIAEQVAVEEESIEQIHGTDVARQLFRVTCGLESMVIGEDEIQGQVTDAYQSCKNYLGGPLDDIVEKAIRVGKRVRSETAINEGNMSMATAATSVARKQCDDITDTESLVIGAGDMGESVAKSLSDYGASVTITNRSYESAQRISEEIGESAACFGDVHRYLDQADLVVTATGAPHPILNPSELTDTSVTIVDIATPRDVPPEAEDIDGIEVFDIDDIGEVLNSTFQRRMNAAKEVEGIIDEELTLMMQQLKKRQADEILSRIHLRADDIRTSEMERAKSRIENNIEFQEDDQEALEEILHDLTSAIVGQLLATPTESIKGAAMEEEYETLQAIADAFNLSEMEHGECDEAPVVSEHV